MRDRARTRFRAMTRPVLEEIVLGDEPGAWRALGFTVVDGVVALGGVRIRLAGTGGGAIGWSLRNLPSGADLDGLAAGRSDAARPDAAARSDAARPDAAPADPTEHPIGATAVDHLVALTPDFDRTVRALREAGLDYRRTREAGGGLRQAFFVLGPCLLELGGPAPGERTARLWGMTLVVDDIDAAATRLGDLLGRVKDAVQPGRRIATVRPEAGLGVPVALITPRR
jgi:hypothetical protein